MKELSDEELGRQLADLAGIKTTDDGTHSFCLCETLCNSLDAIAEVEKIIIEKDRASAYVRALVYAVGDAGNSRATKFIMASARHRAEAALAALQSLGESK